MFHLVFDHRGAELLNAAMDLDNALDGEIVVIGDDYSVGPVSDLTSEAGRELRQRWWNIIHPDNTISHSESDDAVLQKITTRMEEEEFDQIWIWMAPNVRDVCGYYWLISQLSRFSGRIYILSLNNLPFISEKGQVFYPQRLAEIPAREFVKAKRLARPVSPAEFETEPEEWFKLAAENKILRVLEGGKKIVQTEPDFFDKSLLVFIQPAFQKIHRSLQQFQQKYPEKTNEHFLAWRLKHLVHSGAIEQQGESLRLFAREPMTDDR